MKDGEHSDPASNDVDRVHLHRVYAGILALENARRDCWTFQVLFCYYEFIYASIYSIVQNEDRMVHIRTLLTVRARSNRSSLYDVVFANCREIPRTSKV